MEPDACQFFYVFTCAVTVAQVSNPYRFPGTDPATATLPANSCTTTAYDLLGRPTTVTTPDGAAVMTQYYGNQVKVYDQANAQRISETDGLGRLCKVWEVMSGGPDTIMFNGANNNGYLTSYAYDTLDNLTTVAQGAQTRSFAYDSLKRLMSATNPESGAMTYVYDPNGNLCEKTDARTTKTTFVYDSLNRPTQKTYSGTSTEGINAANATPWVCYKYDSATNLPATAPASFNVGFAKGRLVATTYGFGAVSNTESCGTYYGYDELGRVARRTQQIKDSGGAATNYPVTATYNRAGAITGETYPSTQTVSYGYDMTGRLTSFSGTLGTGTSTPYATVTQFSPASQVERETYGMTTPLYLKQAYNNRLQLVDTRLGSVNDATNWDRGRLSLVYGTTTFNLANTRDTAVTEMSVTDLQGNNADNNGNVKRMYHFLPDGKIPQRDDYSYDPLNRLTSMTECQRQAVGGAMVANVANQAYGYDRYGNNTITGLNASGLTFSAANNRITTANYVYDSVGNLTSQNGLARTYDAENRMVTAASSGFYTYDGEGKRVKRTAGSPTCWYVYGIGGELLAEYLVTAPTTATKQYGYEGGKLLVTAEGATLRWLVSDHLGSTRMEVNSAGNVATRHDYLPFGEELYTGIRNGGYAYEPPASSTRQRFGSKERDTETGLDFLESRYFSPAQGRFTSPDPTLLSLRGTNPQTLNRYGYVLNNPLRYVDPYGLWEYDIQYHRNKKNQIDGATINLKKSKEGDNAASLAKQLGFDPSSKEGQKLQTKIEKQLGSGDSLQGAKLGGVVGQVFQAAERGLAAQAKFNEGHPNADPKSGPPDSQYNDCSMTTCRIAFPGEMAGRDQFSVSMADEMIRGLKSVSQDALRTGDIIRYADSQNSPQHFMTTFFTGDDGVTQAFSRSGVSGRFQIVPTDAFSGGNYGTIKGIGKKDSGFYRPPQ